MKKGLMLLLLPAWVSAFASATSLNLPGDGWVSWNVEAVANAPNWCCLDWNGSTSAKPAACDLDGPKQGYSNSKGDTTAQMRVYARFNAGKLERIQALAASCQVTSKTAIKQLVVSEDASIAWLDSVTTNAVASKPHRQQRRKPQVGVVLVRSSARRRGRPCCCGGDA
jgi:hypothetical protein